ncbi:39S ribosomal protein L37, mitochondrial isoform X2 [Syngnathoides biaculeatus]|uniref:39S ribosomal protein L37, mitochondrial isoform X2 n=1 Tax=Syngnathoides biaculeatus TaxID=300417 RepID=UPI002ADDAD1E|nr:39S ribosomal protein L37, mitochondrial isoform X2 [Syngnathoides biaculeatus]
MSMYSHGAVAADGLLFFRHFSKLSWLPAYGVRSLLQARRLSLSRLTAGKTPSVKESIEKVAIPGLDMVTYGERMHFVPGLSKPVWPQWERYYKDPKHFRSPSTQEMPLYHDTPCYVFNERTSALEGVRQALWLTKSKAVSGLPPHLLSLAKNPANKIPNQENCVQKAIKHAHFWDTTQERPVKYSNTLLFNLYHLCATLHSSHPLIGRRMLAEKYLLTASWKRGKNLFQVRGQSGLKYCGMDPIPRISGKQQVLETANHALETFYPVSPTVDLQKVHVYKDQVNCTGFRGQYFYPHAHTLYFLEGYDSRCRLRPEQFRAKMIMFLFGNALAQAHNLFGVWLDEDAELYDFVKVRPLFFKKKPKKQLKVPDGLAGYNSATFTKFLALFLHGAA